MMKKKNLGKGERCTVDRNKYTKVGRGKREKKPKVGIGILEGHRILLARNARRSYHLPFKTTLRLREGKEYSCRCGDGVNYLMGSFLVVHR